MSPAETLLAEPFDSVPAPELAPVALDTNTPPLVVELAPLDTCTEAPAVEELVPPDTLTSPPIDPALPDTDKDPPVPTEAELLAPLKKFTFPPDRPPETPNTLTTPSEAVVDAPDKTPLSTDPVTALEPTLTVPLVVDSLAPLRMPTLPPAPLDDAPLDREMDALLPLTDHSTERWTRRCRSRKIRPRPRSCRYQTTSTIRFQCVRTRWTRQSRRSSRSRCCCYCCCCSQHRVSRPTPSCSSTSYRHSSKAQSRQQSRTTTHHPPSHCHPRPARCWRRGTSQTAAPDKRILVLPLDTLTSAPHVGGSISRVPRPLSNESKYCSTKRRISSLRRRSRILD